MDRLIRFLVKVGPHDPRHNVILQSFPLMAKHLDVIAARIKAMEKDGSITKAESVRLRMEFAAVDEEWSAGKGGHK